MGFVFEQPLTAGVVLLRSAIQSPNYVTGVSGWSVDQSGSAEFNNATFRGTLIAGGGAVIIDSNGVDVHSTVLNTRYRINTTGGFIASLNTADDGRYAKVTLDINANVGGTGGGAFFAGQGANPGPHGGTLDRDGSLFFGYDVSGVNDTPRASLFSPRLTGKQQSFITVRSQSLTSAVNDGNIELSAPDITLNATSDIFMDGATNTWTKNLINTPTLLNIAPAQLFSASISVLVGDTNIALGNTNYPLAFPVGTTVFGVANITTSTGASSLWYVRFLPVSNTQFNLIVSRPAAATANSTLNIHILTFVVA
jgi:hypothetical protein